MLQYVCEGKELYRNDSEKTWVASFQHEEDCQAVADSLNNPLRNNENNPLRNNENENNPQDSVLCSSST